MTVSRPLAERFWEKVDKSDGCWLWMARQDRYGYGWIKRGPGFGSVLAHRVSWELAMGQWPTDQVLHHCDNPPCVRPDHLFLGTPADNARDRASKGRGYRGPRSAEWRARISASLRRRHDADTKEDAA